MRAHTAHCRCGAVEVGAWGTPIIVTTCYCEDCQAASQRLAAAGSPPTAGADGGTEFMLFRRDRIACTRGADRLQPMRLTSTTKTRRMVATCCATPLYAAFDDRRPWVSAFRAGFGAGAPPVEMRICTRSRPPGTVAEDGVPSYRLYPPTLIVRLLAASALTLLSRPAALP